MASKPHRRLFKSEIYLIVSAIFLVGSLGIYGGRFFYYHSLATGKIETPETNLNKLLTATENLSLNGNGLEPYNDGYIYVGFPANNYIRYSGILWQAVSIDQAGRITLIAAEDLTTLPYSVTADNTYATSLIHRYLNPIDGDDGSGIFYKLLKEPEKYLEKGEYCSDTLAAYSEVLKCGEPTTNEYVSLLNINQYILAGGVESYLNIGTNFWTLTGITGSPNVYYVFPKGGIGTQSRTGADYLSFGVRPVITLKANLTIVSGSGLKDSPYSLDDETFDAQKETYLCDQPLAKYVTYAGKTWQIIGTDDNKSTKLLMTDVIRDADGTPTWMSFGSPTYATDNTIGSYLDSTFLASFDHPEYLAEGAFYTGGYSQEGGYSLEQVRSASVTARAGLPSFYELYTTNFIDPGTFDGEVVYWTSNYRDTREGMIWTVHSLDWLMADFYSAKCAVRPAIYLKSAIQVTGGAGTIDDPYQIAEKGA